MIPTANTVRYGAAGGYQNVDVMVSLIRHARIAQEIELTRNTVINGKNKKASLITSINALFRGDNFR
jgi:hypothetical protein